MAAAQRSEGRLQVPTSLGRLIFLSCTCCTLQVWSAFILSQNLSNQRAASPLGCTVRSPDRSNCKGQLTISKTITKNQWAGFIRKFRLQRRATFYSPPSDRIRLWVPTQPLNYSGDGRTHHYVEHRSPMMSHLQIISKIRFSGSDPLDFTVCFTWLNAPFLHVAPKPLQQRLLPTKCCGREKFRLFHSRISTWTGATFASVARISPQVQEDQLVFLAGHESNFFCKTTTFNLSQF